MSIAPREVAVQAADGHRYALQARIPDNAGRGLLWLPALGIAARHYLPLADALAARGIAVCLHEWRGHGSSTWRAARDRDWGYRELLQQDIPASMQAMQSLLPGLPRAIGGHSLGGQLACCHVALQPDAADAIWLAGSGAPYWRAFPLPHRLWLPMAYRFLPWLAARNGFLPGRRIGFGGNEARGVIADWAGTASTGRYAAAGVDADLEAALSRVDASVHAALFDRDWLAPASSLHFLFSKMPRTQARVSTYDTATLGVDADHYAWMKRPRAVADGFVAGA